MLREEALKKFDKIKEDIFLGWEEEFSETLLEHAEKFKDTILLAMERLADCAEKMEKEEIVYLQFSFLRYPLAERKFQVMFHGYNRFYYIDEEPAETEFNLDFLYGGLQKRWDSLEQEAKKFVGKVNVYDVRNAIYSIFMQCSSMCAHALRFLLKDIEEKEQFQRIPRVELYTIRWGEYLDHSEIVIHRDRTKKQQEDWQDTEDKLLEKPDEFVCSCWYQGIFENIECRKTPMQFITFLQCNLLNCDFSESELYGASFLNSNLRECSFTNCNLNQADFRGSHFEDVDFKGASLEGAVFSEEDIPYLHLEEKQLKQIVAEGREPE